MTWDLTNYGEELEFDLDVFFWNGTHFQFFKYVRLWKSTFLTNSIRYPLDKSWIQEWKGQVMGWPIPNLSGGRMLEAILTDSRVKGPIDVVGYRWHVFSFGLVEKEQEDLQIWQGKLRKRFEFLAMNGNPKPLSVEVEKKRV